MSYTIASCCAGFGGLDLAVEAVFGPARHLWHAEYDPECDSANPLYRKGNPTDPFWKGRILAAHWPGVSNLGDLTKVDWAAVPRPNLLTVGAPCKDISAAGRRAGLGPDTRSGVWSHIAYGISVLRPDLVVFENVEALLSTYANRTVDGADSGVGSGPAVVGDRPVGAVLRAAGAVCGDLASIGFDTEWTVVSASDVGAPHRRRRVFLLAWPADSRGVGPWHVRAQGRAGVASAAVAGGAGGDGVNLLPTPMTVNRTSAKAQTGRPTSGPQRGGPSYGLEDVVALLPTPKATDHKRTGSAAEVARKSPALGAVSALLPTPTARDGDGRGEGTVDYWQRQEGRENGQRAPLGAVVNLLPTPRATDGVKGGPNQRGSSGDLMLPAAVQPERWGRYADAIRRWEQVMMGRPAPEATEPGAKGQPRLSPRFVEWMMGLPDGWVTDHVSRNQALHALGDGVVWQQGAYALRRLLTAAATPIGVAA
jgi:DNA (cytosine-5)-methyltransferase 1